MRPQKSKRNRQFENNQKWNKYYLSGTDCAYCQYFRGKKRELVGGKASCSPKRPSCPFNECAHEEERLDAITDRRKIRSKVIT